jgi:hypothetical protein
VLPARARAAIGVDAQVGVVDLDLHVLRLRQDGHGRGRGVDPALGLGVGHALHAVDAAFELEPPEHPVAVDGGDDLLVAADLAFGDAVDLHAPALQVA